MPVFVWMGLVAQLLLVFSLPIITVGLFELLFDRRWGTQFFDPTQGADPVLWQHLFWLFGHPEVYILILPAFGIISEVLPVFSRKPLFGYQFVVFSGIAIGFIGFGVWAHHMFAVGLGPVANTAFGISTAIIAIPTGVKIFNWMATMYKGDLRFTAPMLFSVGAVAMFVIGGLSGVTHAIVPSDYQQTDTYYIVAHFHYVLFGGAIFGLFSAAVLLVAEGVRSPALRRTGQAALLAHDHRVQPDVRADAHPRPAGHDPPGVHVPGVARAHVLERGLHVGRVHHRGVDPGVHRQRGADDDAPPPARDERSVGRAHARVDDRVARRPSTTSTRSRRSTRSTSSGTASTPRTRVGGSFPSRPVPRIGHEPDASHGTAHAIHLPSPSYWPLVAALGLPIMAYGVIYSWWLVGARRRGHARRCLRVGPRALGGGVAMADVAITKGHSEHETTTGLPHTKLAMWLFLSSECLLFGALITTYVLYRNASIKGPYPSDVFDIGYTSVSSFVLLASSLTMVLALAAAQKRDFMRMRLWLVTTAMLGLTFVGGQVYEFTHFYREGLAITRTSSARRSSS